MIDNLMTIIEEADPQVGQLIRKEYERQNRNIELIASENIVSEAFSGSLPSFITAFMSGKKISQDEAEELKKLIDSYKE